MMMMMMMMMKTWKSKHIGQLCHIFDSQ